MEIANKNNSENTGKGMVISLHRDRYELLELEISADIPKFNKRYFAVLKPSAYYRSAQALFPTVGDEVIFEKNAAGDSIILETLPRRSCFLRANPTMGLPDQAVAANFDYVLLVMSLNRDFHLGKLTRYLAAAAKAGGTTVLLLSKADLVGREELADYQRRAEELAPSLPVIPVSTLAEIGLEELKALLTPGKKAVFLGSSGVGKSSLINALMGEEVMKTGDIREADSQGRHTTTGRQCFFLPNGAMLMDTPGMRKIMMSREEGELSGVFEKIEQLIAACRFGNCTHKTEPGCAVREAIESGRLDPKQYEEYTSLLTEEKRARGRELHRLKRLERPGKYGKRERRWRADE